MAEYACTCGARFRSEARLEDHVRYAPRRCLKTDRAVLTPEQYAIDNPSEHGQQVALFMWGAMPDTLKIMPTLRYMFAVPNGGMRDQITASRLKAEGVKSGAPDIFLPVPKRQMHGSGGPVSWTNACGLFIEMKRPKTHDQREGRLSGEQTEFANYLTQVGYVVAVCYSFSEAKNVIIEYLAGTLPLQ